MRTIALIPTAAALSVVLLTVGLGHWQTRRAAEKAALQQAHDVAMARAPAELTAALLAGHAPVGTRVAVVGQLLPEQTVYIDNRTRKGVAGLHVVTPIRLQGSAMHVLILRGWVAGNPAERTKMPAVTAPPGVVRIEGIAEPTPAQALALGNDPAPGPDDRLWQQFSIAKYRQWSGLPVADVIVRQESQLDDGLIREWPVPGNDVDRHHAYAFQWYAMAAVTAALWAWYTFARRYRSTWP